MVIRPFFSALAAACLGGFMPASAVADVLNGNFETGVVNVLGGGFYDITTPPGPTGWAVSSGGGISAGNNQYGLSHNEDTTHHIAIAFSEQIPLTPATIKQTGIATTATAQYALHFWLANPQAADNFNRLTISWGGASVGPPGGIVLGALADWSEYVINVTATSNSTDLIFSGYNASGAILLDDVSLVAVPEPATASLLSIGTLGLALRRRRSRLAA